MESVLIVAALVLLVAVAILQVLSWRKPAGGADLGPLLARAEALERAQERTERGLREEIARNREDAARESRDLRGEVQSSLAAFTAELRAEIAAMSAAQKDQLQLFGGELNGIGAATDARLAQVREALEQRLQAFNTSLVEALENLHRLNREHSESIGQQFGALRDGLDRRLAALGVENQARLDDIRAAVLSATAQMRAEVAESLKAFNDSLVNSLACAAANQSAEMARLTETTGQRLQALQAENAAKLEQIRHTVDEQLQTTLEKRLGESFRIVSERLEQVHRGLGEMQNLASGVGDLKKLLSNVRARGTWGEVQLGFLLEQMLAPEQYATNVATTGTAERVEFAIRLPGDDSGHAVWLPIDSKFPKEDYERLLDAVERADAPGVEECGRQLELRARQCARDIATKYVAPPGTTEFAIMYLPTESLYAEILRRPGLIEALQHDHHVTIAGPMTLAALLNSLQMGFRTLAIQKRSSEVWEVLGKVKTEFGKYGDVLAKVQKKLQEASNTVDTGLTRARAIERSLKSVQQLPADGVIAIDARAEESELEPAGALAER